MPSLPMASLRLGCGPWPAQLLIITAIIALVSVCSVVGARDRSDANIRRRKILLDGQIQRNYPKNPQRLRQQRSDKPNIILILTDDQDVLLGSLKAMPKLHDYMIRRGATFNNTFVSTPMCCPSRSTILTGLYAHNHNVFTNNDNCSSSQWVQQHEPRTFAAYLQKHGYRTGYFGKYLNKYNGTYTPVGWDKWIGLVRNSRFYNYTLSYGGILQKHYDNYYKDYLTDRIANDSVTFLKRSKRLHRTKPVMMVLSVPAPHGPEDAAPQYQHMFVNNTDHRTPSWNIAPNNDKQWLLRKTPPMIPQYKIFTDLLQRRRLQTLQSVDDLIQKVFKELKMLGELDNTYVIYTSDHGYHLGQFGLIKGKSMAYDFDTRVPLIVTGPGIQGGKRIFNIASNVDLAPTLLDMGGVATPSHMDGQSLLPLLRATGEHYRTENGEFITSMHWRDSVLLERGKVSKKMLKVRMREERQKLLQRNQKNLHLYLPSKQQKILRQCSNPKKNLQLPCKPNQKWYCQKDTSGKTRLHKCRHADRERSYNAVLYQGDQPRECRCEDGRLGFRAVASSSSTSLAGVMVHVPTPRQRRHRHRRFLAKKKARARLQRQRRSVMQDAIRMMRGNPLKPLGSSSPLDMFTRRCRILMNDTVSCDQDIYHNYPEWESHREKLDEMIKEYKKILDDLRDIRDHLLDNQPPLYEDSEEVKDTYRKDTRPRVEPPGQGETCVCDVDTISRRVLHEQDDRKRQRQLRLEQKMLRRAQRQEDRLSRQGKRRNKKKRGCNGYNMQCFTHDNDHWKTPPYWEHGPFCFCSNSNNNTYWCLRTINTTSDFLYCEYITNFIAFYNMHKDPFQLTNVAKSLNYGVLQQLHDKLAMLKDCQGKDDCNLNSEGSRPVIHTDTSWSQRTVYDGSVGQPYGTFATGNNFRASTGSQTNWQEEFYDEDNRMEQQYDPDFF